VKTNVSYKALNVSYEALLERPVRVVRVQHDTDLDMYKVIFIRIRPEGNVVEAWNAGDNDSLFVGSTSTPAWFVSPAEAISTLEKFVPQVARLNGKLVKKEDYYGNLC